MTGLAPKKQAELLARRLRPPIRADRPGPARPVSPITPMAIARRSGGFGSLSPTTRRIDTSGRFTLHGLTDEMSWRPGRLSVQFDGPWVVLSQTDADVEDRRRDGVTVDANGRIRLNAAIRQYLARLDAGDEVLVARIPAAAAVAVTHPGLAVAVRPPAVLHELATNHDDSAVPLERQSR